MKKFLLRGAFFGLIMFLFGRGLESFAPYHWGNPWSSSKISYLEDMGVDNDFDTYFFGSSRVYRQIDPKTFDSTYSAITNQKIKSFNLGAPALFCPENYYLYEHFLESSTSDQMKNAFIELTNITPIAPELMHQERTTYFQNYSDVNFAIRSFVYSSGLSVKEKLVYTRNYLVAWCENLFNIGQFGYAWIHPGYYKQDYVGPNKDGFYSLERQLAFETDFEVLDDLQNRRNYFLSHQEELIKRAGFTSKYFETDIGIVDSVHLGRVLSLIELSKQKNVNLIFVLPPRVKSQMLVNLYRLIPAQNKIQLSNAKDWPDLYEINYSFDKGHLNDEGSRLYSVYLANEFAKLNQK
ncbi:hypothetical protein [Reichenbachiella sp.]